jgi:3-oxoacyl-[acyl-carrier-protein] synthase II
MENGRVVVTGFGAVSRLENGSPVGDLRSYCRAAASGHATSAAAPEHRTVGEFHPGRVIPENVLRRMNRFTQMAMVATYRALERAQLEITPERAERVGLVFNTCFGPFDSTRSYILKVIRDGAKKASASVFPNTVHNAFTGLITMDLKALGSNSTVSGYNAVCYGLDLIRNGYDDAVIVGGCDELIEPIILAFEEAQMGKGDARRMVLGEGAAVLVLESAEFAAARGATALAEILDYGMSSAPGVGTSAFACDSDALEHAMRQALQRSGLQPADIDAVSTCANGSDGLERAEEGALRSVFGASGGIPLVNMKCAVGETLGAAAPFGSMLGVALLDERARETTRHVMVNNVELGGTITSMVMSRVGVADGLYAS